MSESASPEHLQALLEHRRADAVANLGRETTAIQADGAKYGAIGSGRLAFQYIAAAERIWRTLVEDSIDDLRRYVENTGLPAKVLIPIVRSELGRGLTDLRKASKLDAPAGVRLQDRGAASEHIEGAWAKLPHYF